MNFSQRQLPACTSPEAYLELFRDCFPETLGTSIATGEHYGWKYGRQGKIHPAFEFGGYDAERMIGYYAGLPFLYRVDGKDRPGVLVCDVMTHSSMRGQGIFTRQGRYATDAMREAGMDLCVGFPIRPEVFPGHIKVGWKIAFDLPVYFKLTSLRSLFAPRGASWLGAILDPLPALHRAVCRATRPSAGQMQWEALSPDEFLRRYDYAAFLERWSRQYANSQQRTEEFLRWRLSAPQKTYRVIAATADGELAGFAVACASPLTDFRVISVLSFMVRADRRAAAGPLHDGLAAFAREEKVAGIVIMTTRPDARQFRLLRNGYVPSPIRFKLIVKWLSGEPEPASLLDAAAWHLGWLDTDVL